MINKFKRKYKNKRMEKRMYAQVNFKKIFEEIKVVTFQGGTLCRANCLKRLSDHYYVVVSLDYLYEDEPIKDIKFKEQNYHELIQEEIENSFLKWYPSLEQALNKF